LTGGYDSGFRQISLLVREPRLFQCKGKRNVRVKQVANIEINKYNKIIIQVPLNVDSLNLGDVFILDAGEKILVWTPPGSGRLERIKVCV
jgi:gelsolin